MKTVKYLIVLIAVATSLNSCVIRAHGPGYVRGHYEYGPHGGRHWVPAHYN